ncbi:LysR family transcriptional regulator [Nocardioides sp. BP30]|uniref:LysR family transcriptional regulator n=1 Tax=Nocardioides sp. BP30 TaxID=3036374 RepID=UPI0024684636|nr:LysR family transcriptional regulator [Nocardioides sp. BP30]WGL51799.1 LysR family transcriptional regulator [Nocardioides sp. BP30]
MRIEQLEYIAAVTQLGSLRRASEHLHVSQPALSEAVSKLERELGVALLDRRRSGARISRAGRDLLPRIEEVLQAVDALRTAAGDQRTAARAVRLGTVNTATSQLLFPSLRSLQQSHPEATVEVLDMLQAEIEAGLAEGTLDLGLVNVLPGDDLPISVQATPLLTGRPVVVLPAWHPYAAQPEVSVEDLRREPFILMRSGYVMHRLAHRLFGERLPPSCRTTDGAEMGKLMVSEGLGLTLLPAFSVTGDPLERAGAIVARPIVGAGDAAAAITLLLVERRDPHPSEQVAALVDTLTQRARTWTEQVSVRTR